MLVLICMYMQIGKKASMVEAIMSGPSGMMAAQLAVGALNTATDQGLEVKSAFDLGR
jgi:hypothetical protein